MTAAEKLAAILAAVQIDPGGRGLTTDPRDNLFTACRDDFEAACRRLARSIGLPVLFCTGFPIPTGTPPTCETDGPLGAFFLHRALQCLAKSPSLLLADSSVMRAWESAAGEAPHKFDPTVDRAHTTTIAIECAGPSADGIAYSMRGRNLNSSIDPTLLDHWARHRPTIAIGDGGNEIGMGKIPHQTIVRNIPNGDQIHCRIPAEYLIVAGVSNWGAYALAAGLFVLRGETPPPHLFDPDRERQILEIMVRDGPLVDGVTGKQTVTVDGLSWDEYIAPFNAIREILMP